MIMEPNRQRSREAAQSRRFFLIIGMTVLAWALSHFVPSPQQTSDPRSDWGPSVFLAVYLFGAMAYSIVAYAKGRTLHSVHVVLLLVLLSGWALYVGLYLVDSYVYFHPPWRM
jgi:hypothetical protein